MTIATELGDKTFCIAAVMAMKYPRVAVFAGAIGALVTMTVLSVGIGVAVPALLPKFYTHYAAAALFAYFGVKLLREARAMSKEEAEKEARGRSGSGADGSAAGAADDSDQGELAEAEEEVAKLELKLGPGSTAAGADAGGGASSRSALGAGASAASSGAGSGIDVEAGPQVGSPSTTSVMPSSSAASARARKGDAGTDASPAAAAEGPAAGAAVAATSSASAGKVSSSGSGSGGVNPGALGWLAAVLYLHIGANWPVFTHSFSITFLAEWGDRSQIATIAMAAAANPFGVCLGAAVGHALCTGLAVLGGRMLASRISEKTVAYVGGVLFLIFAVHSLIIG